MKKTTAFFATLIVIASFSVYLNSLQNEFLWDDKVLISENDSIKDWKYLKENFVTHLYAGTKDASNFYRPVLKLSFMLDWSIWKDNVLGWHFVNIVLHTLNAVFIFFIFSVVLKNYIASFITAMFFAVHPLFTSAVVYISGRGDPLALFFMLISFLFFIKLRYAFSVLFFIFAILTKETAIILPLLLFAYERLFRENEKRGLTPFLPYIAVCAVYGALRFTVFNFPFVPTLTSGSTVYLRLLTMSKILFIYLGLLVFPLGLHMERNIPYAKSFFELQIMLSFAAVIAIAYFVYKNIYRRDGRMFFGALWFLIALLPVSNIRALNMSMAEHWMYVPAIGLFSCAGLVLSRLIQRTIAWKMAAWGVFGIFILFFSYTTIAQNRTWRNEKNKIKVPL